MKNSNLNNEYLDDEIDLRELLRTIFNSKKLIILITLASALLAFIYNTQKEAEYHSTVILELGSYTLLDGEKKLVEPVSSLIKKLKVGLVYKNQPELNINNKKLNFTSIEDQLLEVNYTSTSAELNETIINEAIIFSQKSHAEIIAKIINSLDNEIEFLKNSIENQQESKKLNAINALKILDNEIEFLKNSIENQQESKKLNAINSIKTIDNEIPTLEAKIKYLLKLIPEEENNLLLLESDSSALLRRASSSPTLQQIIYTYNEQTITLKNQIKNLQQEKEALEMQVKSIGEGEFRTEQLFKLNQDKEALEMQVKSIGEGEFRTEQLFKLNQDKEALEMQVKSIGEGEFRTEQLFKLNQDKEALEMQTKLVNDQTNMTQPIRELETNEIKQNTLVIILIGAILGFIFSVFIVFIRQVFLEEQN